VATFDSYLEEHGKNFPGGKELLAASSSDAGETTAHRGQAPDQASKEKFDTLLDAVDDKGKDKLLCDFTYDDDMSAAKCRSAHTSPHQPARLARVHARSNRCPGS